MYNLIIKRERAEAGSRKPRFSTTLPKKRLSIVFERKPFSASEKEGETMLAIKFYSTMPSDNENVLKGISANIPALVIDLNTFPDYPTDETFTQMTNEEYANYMKSIQIELDEWKIIRD